MPEYKAPLRDTRFVLNEVFEADKLWASLPTVSECVDPETADAILEEAAKMASGLIGPLNREGDEEACKLTETGVQVPTGVKEAYQTFAEGGWCGLGGNPDFGGMGMPKTLVAQVEEMMQGANMAFGLYPMLNAGACLSINVHATEELKETYLPNMYEGKWLGSMCLTEAHSGTDLGIIRTKATDNGDGSYNVTGNKIFITAGEHELCENIIHLVLAKLPDAPAGPRGISLFIVPRFNVNADGSLGEANNVSAGSIEHKMGIKASPTCVMNFDGSRGYLVGELNKGLACMFTMMNYERLGVGIQGVGVGEASYQSAVEYAKDRIQGRAMTGAQCPDKAADPIIVHADVRRMLLTMKATNEGGRAFSTYVASQLDISKFSDDADRQARASAMVQLLTPISKAFMTDMGFENCVHGQMVFGGHGYIREWGQEQLVRDARIAQIYEGTNGVQALDLMGRKIVADKGAMFAMFATEIKDFAAASGEAEMAEFNQPMLDALATLEDLTAHVMTASATNPNEIGAASVEYLHAFGYTAYSYMWARMAKVALAKQADDTSGFYCSKLKTARFFNTRILPRVAGLAGSVKGGADVLFDFDEDQF